MTPLPSCFPGSIPEKRGEQDWSEAFSGTHPLAFSLHAPDLCPGPKDRQGGSTCHRPHPTPQSLMHPSGHPLDGCFPPQHPHMRVPRALAAQLPHLQEGPGDLRVWAWMPSSQLASARTPMALSTCANHHINHPFP